jgi:hypothetical protein
MGYGVEYEAGESLQVQVLSGNPLLRHLSPWRQKLKNGLVVGRQGIVAVIGKYFSLNLVPGSFDSDNMPLCNHSPLLGISGVIVD